MVRTLRAEHGALKRDIKTMEQGEEDLRETAKALRAIEASLPEKREALRVAVEACGAAEAAGAELKKEREALDALLEEEREIQEYLTLLQELEDVERAFGKREKAERSRSLKAQRGSSPFRPGRRWENTGAPWGVPEGPDTDGGPLRDGGFRPRKGAHGSNL